MDSIPTITESQVDWLTASNHDAYGSRKLEYEARTLAARYESIDNVYQPFRLMGFQGWHMGRVRFGSRGAAGLVQLSGQLASDHWHEIYHLADNVSRIDVQVTARWPWRDRIIGSELWTDAWTHYRQDAQYPRPEMHQDGDGGFTFQLGRRGSPWVLRVYDKMAEVARYRKAELDEQYANCWRFEVEAKAAAALKVAEALSSSTTEVQDCRVLVASHLERHGLDVPFPTDTVIRLGRSMHRASDRLSKLNWLDKSVRPAVEWLTSQYDSGEVYRALGLAIQEASKPDGCEFP